MKSSLCRQQYYFLRLSYFPTLILRWAAFPLSCPQTKKGFFFKLICYHFYWNQQGSVSSPFLCSECTNQLNMYTQHSCILTNHCNTCYTPTAVPTYNATQYHNWAAHILNACMFSTTNWTHNQNLDGPDKGNEVTKHCNLPVQSTQQISTNYTITFYEVSLVDLHIKVFRS
jgi:hypothetical protein